MEITPGVKTSEFWSTLIVSVMSLLSMFGVIEPAKLPDMEQMAVQIVSGAIALVATVSYIYSRTAIKTQQLKSMQVVAPTVQG